MGICVYLFAAPSTQLHVFSSFMLCTPRILSLTRGNQISLPLHPALNQPVCLHELSCDSFLTLSLNMSIALLLCHASTLYINGEYMNIFPVTWPHNPKHKNRSVVMSNRGYSSIVQAMKCVLYWVFDHLIDKQKRRGKSSFP